jgi:hypothetical protein
MPKPETSLTIEGTAGGETLQAFNSYSTLLIGYDGNDTFLGSDTHNVVQFNSLYHQNAVDLSGWLRQPYLLLNPDFVPDGDNSELAATYSITVDGPEGFDRVVNPYQVSGEYNGPGIKALSFEDGVLYIPGHEEYARMSRLFNAVLGREPDAFALATLDPFRLESVASTIIRSDEFRARVDTSSPEAFIDGLYKTVFGRAATDREVVEGTFEARTMGMEAVLLKVGLGEKGPVLHMPADSREAYFVSEITALDTYRLYLSTLGRNPDGEGLSYWIEQRQAGMTQDQQANLFIASTEFAERSQSQDNQSFVRDLYANGLGREAEAEGLSFWTAQLDNGLSRATLVKQITFSHEMSAHIADLAHDGIALI